MCTPISCALAGHLYFLTETTIFSVTNNEHETTGEWITLFIIYYYFTSVFVIAKEKANSHCDDKGKNRIKYNNVNLSQCEHLHLLA